MSGSAGSKAQKLARHQRLHPGDMKAAKASGSPTKRSAPKQKHWTRETKELAEMAVASGYKGNAVIREWARGDIYGGKRLVDAKAVVAEKARILAREADQAERTKRYNEKKKAEKLAAATTPGKKIAK